MHVPRKCPECEASWCENGLPCPDIVNEVVDEGVWRCHGCRTIVASEDVGSGPTSTGAGSDTRDDTPSDGAVSLAAGPVAARIRQLVTVLSR